MILRGITGAWDVPFLLVEGNADLTPSRLLGHHNPARVLREDYSPANFVPRPLIQAMESGGFLYIEELNRAPEDTLNTLLAAMAERQVALPRVGTVSAAATFRVLASMNPYDNVGTARISASVYDRWCRLSLGDVRGGGDYAGRVLDAAHLALSARIAVDETVGTTPEAVITELWENHFILGPRRSAPGPRRIVVDNAVELPGEPGTTALPRLRPLARKPKRLDEAPCLYRSGGTAPVVVELIADDRHENGAVVADPGAAQQGSMVTGETARLRPLDDLLEPSATDPEVARMAERIARRLSIRRPTRDHSGVRGSGRLESLPYRYGSDDIDLDRTIEVLAERPVPEDTDIIVGSGSSPGGRWRSSSTCRDRCGARRSARWPPPSGPWPATSRARISPWSPSGATPPCSSRSTRTAPAPLCSTTSSASPLAA